MDKIRCVDCRSEFDEMLQATECPKCGSKSTPLWASRDVSIDINWHELRILTFWAENWANHIDRSSSSDNPLLPTVKRIVRQLEKQRKALEASKSVRFAPLSLSGEVEELQDEGHDVELRDSNGRLMSPQIGRA